MNKRHVGDAYEEKAVAFLKKQGFRVVEQNFRIRQGEIDSSGYHNGQLVFVEVKYRKNLKAGSPAAAVGIQKQMQICKVALFYLSFRGLKVETACRYDVVAICQEEITWFQNAFEHIGF